VNGRAKGRQGDLSARQEWTERLRRFSTAGPGKPREEAIEAALKLAPGGALRDMLRAYGYSPSARGRKPKGASLEKTARERLESTLNEIFGKEPTPVPSLYAKLAGRIDTTVKDALRVVTALIRSWPEPLERSRGPKSQKERISPQSLAESFVRELLAEISTGRSHEWSESEMETLTFTLVDEKRVGVTQFIKTAGEEEGALIVSGAKRILLGGNDPVNVMRQFHSLTSQFIGEGHKGILIFVFNSAIFAAGKEGFNLLYNQGLLNIAMIAFALFPENYDFADPIQEHEVDWSKWQTLSQRCCVVIRKPPLVHPITGQFLRQHQFDDFVSSWHPKQRFDQLGEVQGFFRFESGHVLPRTYPSKFGPSLQGGDLYWDVLVRPAEMQPDGLEVQYFVPPNQQAAVPVEVLDYDEFGGATQAQRVRRRPPAKPTSIEQDFFYLVQLESPGAPYDDAQRAIYRAARGRLNLDVGEMHLRNLNFAAALRQIGYEVFPISVLLSLFSKMLDFATAGALK
jgi:hypothetical protein